MTSLYASLFSVSRRLHAARLGRAVAPAVLGAVAMTASGAAIAGPCTGPGAPTDTQTKCVTAIQIPGKPLQSFDISWVNPDRAEYYLGDRSNAGIDIIDTRTNTFKRTIGGFVGVVLNPNGTVKNSVSGPDGVTSHGRWLYGGDGNSTLKVIDLDAPTASALKASIPTGGTTRVDEMALTTDGKLLLAANNAEDPPFATLFRANGDSNVNTMGPSSIIRKIAVDASILPAGFGLSLEQPAWDPKTQRFYVSIPIIANNPTGCNYGQVTGAPITCHGGLLVIDPASSKTTYGAFDPTTNTGVVALNECGPNGATVGPHDNLLLGCTPGNNPSDTSTLVINARTRHFANIGDITGSDEVWFNPGDRRYYTGSSRNLSGVPGVSCPNAPQTSGPNACPALGVINAETNLLVEVIAQGSGSHSVAADAYRNKIFVPQVAPASVVKGGDTTGVSAGICGNSTNGCVAVYFHDVDHDHDHDHDDEVADNH
ncbi:MAG TPA: hypothetical protein VFA12_17890 [Stellaceae bacterium]|nr:hypothetical protein [Stellaceae bacterium]